MDELPREWGLMALLTPWLVYKSGGGREKTGGEGWKGAKRGDEGGLGVGSPPDSGRQAVR